jgi:hypothetical protein
LVAIAACHRAPHVETCSDDLAGAWRGSDGQRWMVTDRPDPLEVFPIFTDTAAPEGVVAAPRMFDLTRTGTLIAGTVHRRYERRADACEAHAPVHVAACKDDELEIVLGEPAAPTGFAPCTWPPPSPARVERWRRE